MRKPSCSQLAISPDDQNILLAINILKAILRFSLWCQKLKCEHLLSCHTWTNEESDIIIMSFASRMTCRIRLLKEILYFEKMLPVCAQEAWCECGGQRTTVLLSFTSPSVEQTQAIPFGSRYLTLWATSLTLWKEIHWRVFGYWLTMVSERKQGYLTSWICHTQKHPKNPQFRIQDVTIPFGIAILFGVCHVYVCVFMCVCVYMCVFVYTYKYTCLIIFCLNCLYLLAEFFPSRC